MRDESVKSVIKIIEENKDLLNNNNFEELYKKVPGYLRKTLTVVLEMANINPLIHMEIIPNYYYYDGDYPENTTIIIPSNIESIGRESFSRCNNLKKLIIDGCTRINNEAITRCDDLEEVIIREGTEIIEWENFYYCPKLTKVTLPSSLKVIGEEIFANSNKLFGTSINFNGTMEQWEKINIVNPNGALYSLSIVCTDGTISPKFKFYL